MAYRWMIRRRWPAAGILLLSIAVVVPISFAGKHLPANGTGGRDLSQWMNSSGSDIEETAGCEQVLASAVRTFEATALDRAEARLRTSIEAMLEHTRASGAVSAPEMCSSKKEWICGGCIDVDWWDWAGGNADYGIEPFEFIGADPRDAISHAFVSCQELTIDQIDDGPAGRRTTDDAGEIHAAYLDLMLGVVAGDEPWVQPEWGLIAPQDFTVSLGLRPNLRVTMTGEVFLLAEIDTRQGRIVIHSDGKRGVYRWRTRRGE